MSEENKKSKKSLIETFPLDCWCHIVLFLHSPNDLLNIVLSIHGLWPHIRVVHPHCTRNIVFTLKRVLPVENTLVSHIHTLVHHEDSVMGQPNTDENSVNRFFIEILEIFKNLKVFDVWIKKKPGDLPEDASIKLFEPREGVENLAPCLRKLILTLHGCNVSFRPLFPQLEVLDLTDYNEASHSNHTINGHSLQVDWKNFPRLQTLILFGWKLNGSLEPLRETLRNLKLVSTVIVDDEISDFHHLESLFLGLRTIGQVKKIERLEQLTHLQILVREMRKYEKVQNFFNWTYMESRVTTRFQIRDFPKLRTINFHATSREGDNGSSWAHVADVHTNDDDRRTKLVLWNLPSLREFSADGIRFNIELAGTSSLASVRMRGCAFDTNFLSRIDVLALKDLQCRHSFFSPHMVSLIPFMKNLRRLSVDDFQAGELIENVTEICGFEHLVEILAMECDIYLSKVSECPNLETLFCRTVEEFTLSEVPKLYHIGSRGYQSNIGAIFQSLSTQPQITQLSLEHFFFGDHRDLFCNENIGNIVSFNLSFCDTVIYDGENSSSLMYVRECQFGGDGGTLKLSNHPNLLLIEYDIQSSSSSFAIENCPKLEFIDLSFDGITPQNEEECLSIELKDLQSCNALKLRGNFHVISSFAISGSSVFVRRLCLKRMNVHKYPNYTPQHKFRIDQKSFPFLEVLEIMMQRFNFLFNDDEEEEQPKLCQIEEISDLKSLKLVVVEEDEVGYSTTSDCPFVKRVVRGGMDLEKIKFFSVSNEYFEEDHRELKNEDILVFFKNVSTFKKFIDESKSIVLE